MDEAQNSDGESPKTEPPDESPKTEPPTAEAQAEPDPLETARSEIARLRDQLLRTAADYDNFRKRARRETQDAELRSKEDFFREILPVFDNLERAAQHAESATDVKSLADGIAMVMRLFGDTLTKLGIERVSALGQAFDPALHEAVQQFETSEYAPGTIAAEVQAGYRLGDRLVRPSMVVVAKPPPN